MHTSVVKSKQTKVARSGPCAPRPESPLQAHRRRPARMPRSRGLEREEAVPTFLPRSPRPRDPDDPLPPSPAQPSPAQPSPGFDGSAPRPSSREGLRCSEPSPSGLRPAAHVQGGRREEGKEGRGGGKKARESALRAAPLPRASQQRALGGSGPNRARRLASSASAASGLRGSPGLSEVPGRPGSPLHRPAPAPQSAPGEGSCGRARLRLQPRVPAPRGDEGRGR